jgi:SAM-dependent methyltransferase
MLIKIGQALFSQVKVLFPIVVRRKMELVTCWPPVGRINWGDLGRLTPVSSKWGGDRGTPVDRYYIQKFLAQHARDIRGTVLEIGNDRYCRQFGGDRVEKCEILHENERNPRASYVADLSDAPHIPDNYFDCIICTQTLMLFAEPVMALETIHRILKPNGVLLASVPGISMIYEEEGEDWTDYWRFTTFALRFLTEKMFAHERITVSSKGNVQSASAFLYGVAAEELPEDVLDNNDERFQMIILLRAVK